MKNKVYTNDMKSLAEYIADIKNTFKIKSFIDMSFTRTNKREDYKQTLENLKSDEVTSQFSVLIEPDGIYVKVVINSFKIQATTKYSSIHLSSWGKTAFSFEIPQAEKIINISEFMDNEEISFIKAEKSADFIIKDHINKAIESVFIGKIADTQKEWFLLANDYEQALKLGIVANYEKTIKID